MRFHGVGLNKKPKKCSTDTIEPANSKTMDEAPQVKGPLKNWTLFNEQQIMSETLTECKRHSTSSLSPKFRNNLVEFSFWMTLGSLSQIHIQNITNHKHYIFVSVLLSCTLQCTVVIRLFCLLSDTWVTFFEIRYVLFVLSDWWNIYICEEGTRVLLKRIPPKNVVIARWAKLFDSLFCASDPSICLRLWAGRKGKGTGGGTGHVTLRQSVCSK